MKLFRPRAASTLLLLALSLWIIWDISPVQGAPLAESKGPLDLLTARLENIQQGIKGTFSYEIEMVGKPLGRLLRLYADAIRPEATRQIAEYFSTAPAPDLPAVEFKDQIRKTYLTPESLRDIRAHHPELFKKLTQGLDSQSVNAWIQGSKRPEVAAKNLELPKTPKIEDTIQTALQDLGNLQRQAPTEQFGQYAKDASGLYLKPGARALLTDPQGNPLRSDWSAEDVQALKQRWKGLSDQEIAKVVKLDLVSDELLGFLYSNSDAPWELTTADLPAQAPRWAKSIDRPHAAADGLEIKHQRYHETSGAFLKELDEIKRDLGISRAMDAPLRDLSGDFSLHLNIAVPDFPTQDLEAFLSRYKDLMVGRMLDSDHRLINPFDQMSTATYNPGELRFKEMLSWNLRDGKARNHFEIRVQTASPEDTIRELFSGLRDVQDARSKFPNPQTPEEMRRFQQAAFGKIDAKIKELQNKKFVQRLFSRMGEEEDIRLARQELDETLRQIRLSDHSSELSRKQQIAEAEASYKRLIKGITRSHDNETVVKWDALNFLLERYYPDQYKKVLNAEAQYKGVTAAFRRDAFLNIAEKHGGRLDLMADHYAREFPAAYARHLGKYPGLSDLLITNTKWTDLSEAGQLRVLKSLENAPIELLDPVLLEIPKLRNTQTSVVNQVLKLIEDDHGVLQWIEKLDPPSMNQEQLRRCSQLLSREDVFNFQRKLLEGLSTAKITDTTTQANILKFWERSEGLLDWKNLDHLVSSLRGRPIDRELIQLLARQGLGNFSPEILNNLVRQGLSAKFASADARRGYSQVLFENTRRYYLDEAARIADPEDVEEGFRRSLKALRPLLDRKQQAQLTTISEAGSRAARSGQQDLIIERLQSVITELDGKNAPMDAWLDQLASQYRSVLRGGIACPSSKFIELIAPPK